MAAQPCPPHARLAGDPAAVASVGAELTKLGVVVSDAPSACRTLDATVEPGPDGGYAIAIQHGEGRTVGDAAVAATWLDSWLVDDFGGPTFTAKLASAPIVARQEPVTEADAYADMKLAPRLGVALSAAVDQAWTFDGARWTGLSVGACVQVGKLCFGATGRYATQSMLVGQTAAARSDLSVLATASLISQVGRFQVVPELGVGAGWMATKRVDGCRVVPLCDPDDPHCSMPPVDPDCAEHDQEHAYAVRLDDHYHASTVTPRVRASVKLAVALADHLWLDGIAAVMVSPFDHGDAYGLPSTTPQPFGIPKDQLALPGESIGTFELGLGLRWGMP